MSYFRVILQVPEALTFGMLTPDQQAEISRVFGQYVMPMPGTIPTGGVKLVDAVTADNFHPENMAALGLDWPILGMWDNAGDIVIPLDATKFKQHLIPPVV